MENIVKEILQNEKISFDRITKATSGFTNLVYFIDDNLVVKISKDENTKKKIDKETSIYKNITLDCIPKYIASGEIQDYKYLIISKVKGKSLYSIWHTLTNETRQNCIIQIANILKQFNKQNGEFLAEEYKDLDWEQYLTKELQTKVNLLSEMKYNTSYLEKYILLDLPKILAENKYGLVYNDAHFDNFIYDNDNLCLIDFDRVRVCPIDYEMLIYKTMCDNPSKFASEEDECNIKDEDYVGIYSLFRNTYPEMFENKYIDQRIALYQFNYLIGQAIKCKDSEWINALLLKFEEREKTHQQ